VGPTPGKDSEQFPTATVAVQDTPAPPEIVTMPVGVPAPGAAAVTLKLTVIGWPTTGDAVEVPVIVTVELSMLTTGPLVEAELLPR